MTWIVPTTRAQVYTLLLEVCMDTAPLYRTIATVVATGGLWLLAPASIAQASCDWQWQNPLPTGHTWTDVDTVGSTLIAVGEHGTVATSSNNGDSWTITSITTANLHAVATDGSRVVAVGEDGTVASWSDIEGWRLQSVGDRNLWDLTVLRGSWVAIGDDGVSLSSRDGVSWQEGEPATVQPLYAVAHYRDQLVAVGGGGAVVVSTDGRQWHPKSSGVVIPLFAVVEYNGQLVAAGLLGTTVTSRDTDNWTTIDAPTLSAVRALQRGDDDRLYALSSNGVFVTDDAAFWQREPTGEAVPRGLLAATTTPDGMLVVGELGLIAQRRLSGQWQQLSSGSTAWWSGLAAASPSTVLVGKHPGGGAGVIAVRHEDDTGWHVVATTDRGVNDVVWTGARFLAVGDGGSIWLSEDGLDWTLPELGTNRVEPLTSVVWTGDRAVAVGGDGTALVSEDGARWSRHYTGAISTLHDVAFNGELLVAVGDNGTILSSPDGVVWTRHRSFTPVPLFSVVANADGFVAVGVSGVIVTSRDGRSWSEISTGFFDILRSVTWDGTRFLAVGDDGTLLTSANGESWSEKQLPTGRSLQLVTSDGDRTLVAGWYGAVLASSCQPTRARRITAAPAAMIVP